MCMIKPCVVTSTCHTNSHITGGEGVIRTLEATPHFFRQNSDYASSSLHMLSEREGLAQGINTEQSHTHLITD
jgi:hypothetical protein